MTRSLLAALFAAFPVLAPAQDITGLEGGSPELVPGQQAATPVTIAPLEPAAELAARAAWWAEAKFGMFIHFGLYSALAGEWQGKKIGSHGEWIQQKAPISNADYAATAATFNPTKFDAKRWVAIAKSAGMRYVVLTAKHHDGFAMFDSAVSDFTIVKATPFKRDVVRELSEACRDAGLRFGVYYSNDLDWHENMWTLGQHDGADPARFDAYYRGKAMAQVKELLTKYGPMATVWFDGRPRTATVDQALAFRTMIRQLQPETLINNRLRAVPADFFNYEQRLPRGVDPQRWEGCMTTNGSWGFKRSDQDWKSTKLLLFKLVDAVSKGGNMLLNVGPDGEGVIPEIAQQRLADMGAWMATHGEAIYGATATPLGAEFGAEDPVRKDSKGKPVFNPDERWRCTVKPGRRYITVFEATDGHVDLPRAIGTVAKATLLGDTAQASLTIQPTEQGWRILLPPAAQAMLAPVIRLDLVDQKP